MTPEVLFFTKLVKGQDYDAYNSLKIQGFARERFPELYHPVLEFIDSYALKYNQLPGPQEVLDVFPTFSGATDTLFTKEVPAGALAAIYDNLVKKSLRSDIYEHLREVATHYEDEGKDPFDILRILQRESVRLASDFMTQSEGVETFAESAKNLLDELDGKVEIPKGIPSSFLFVEDQANGLQPGELTSVTGTTGSGKTWLLCCNAATATTGNPLHFYDEGTVPEGLVLPTREERNERKKRVLFVSLEMPPVQIMRRMAALYARVSYARYRAGELTTDEDKRLRAALAFMSDDPDQSKAGSNLKVLGPSVADTPDAVHAAATDFDADIVIIDGFYLMRGPGEKRWEKVESIMQELRLHSLQTNRHYMLATQLRREAKTLSSTGLDSLSFSASIGHDSTNVFALVQTKNDRASNIANISVLKMRDGVQDQQYIYNWDHQEGIYTQQGLAVDETEFNPFV